MTIAPERSEIVLAPDACETVQFAAEELNAQLQRAFGEALPVVTNPTPGKASILLGDTVWSRAAGIDVKPLARDAFVIKSDAASGRIYVAGRDTAGVPFREAMRAGQRHRATGERATLFGVYEFLERFAGVRFYFPGEIGTVVSRQTSFDVPEGETTVAPTFLVRSVLCEGLPGAMYTDGTIPEEELRSKGEEGRKADINRWKALQWQRLRMETETIPASHGMRGFTFPDRFATTHPEYFVLREKDGKLVRDASESKLFDRDAHFCMSSGIWDEMFEDIKAYLDGKKAESRGIRNTYDKKKFAWNRNFRKPYIDVMPPDGIARCLCDKCKAEYDEGPAFCDTLVWSQTAKLARRLTAAGYDCIITQMAYDAYRPVPNVDLPSNVWVKVAEAGPWALACPDEVDAEIDEVRRWSEKLGHKVWMWTYPSKFGNKACPGVPDMAPRAWSDYYRRTMPYSIGSFCESETEKSIYHYLNYYAYSRLAWHPEEKIDDILAEHHRLMFGKASPEMASFYDMLEEKWTKGAMGRWYREGLGWKERTATDVDLWGTIYSTAVRSRLAELIDRASAKLGADSLEARRVAFVRREFLEPILAAGRAFDDGNDEGRVRARYAKLTAEGKNLLPKMDAPVRIATTNAEKSVSHRYGLKGKIKPNTRYRVSGYFKLRDVRARGNSKNGGCFFNGNIGRWKWFPSNFCGATLFDGSTDGWVYREYEMVSPPQEKWNKDPIFYEFVMARATGEAWIDCFAFEELGPLETKSER